MTKKKKKNRGIESVNVKVRRWVWIEREVLGIHWKRYRELGFWRYRALVKESEGGGGDGDGEPFFLSSILRWISFPFLERERERERQWEWDFCLMDLVWFGGNLRENRVSKACFKYISNDVYKATSYLVNRFTAKDFCWHMTVIVGMDDFYLDKILYFL